MALKRGAEKLDPVLKAFPQRLKPHRFVWRYGVAEATPFQNKDFFSPFKTRTFSADTSLVHLKA
jgi:hypothetical protein